MRARTWLAAATMLVVAGLVIGNCRFVGYDPGRIATSAGPRWDSARVVGERRLLVSFLGGRPTDRPRACAPTYSASVRKTATEIVIRLRAREFRPLRGSSCVDIGYPHTISVQLARPVGDRIVRDGQTGEVKDVAR